MLENDYCSILRNRLKQGYPSGYLDLTQAYNVLQNSLQQGRLQPGDAEQTRTAFIVCTYDNFYSEVNKNLYAGCIK